MATAELSTAERADLEPFEWEEKADVNYWIIRRESIKEAMIELTERFGEGYSYRHIEPFVTMMNNEYELCVRIVSQFDVIAQILKTKRKPKQAIPKDLRWKIWERDNFTCHYCESRRDLSIDHKIPESQGGTLDEDNLVTSCKPCNSKKGTMSFEEFDQLTVMGVFFKAVAGGAQ